MLSRVGSLHAKTQQAASAPALFHTHSAPQPHHILPPQPKQRKGRQPQDAARTTLNMKQSSTSAQQRIRCASVQTEGTADATQSMREPQKGPVAICGGGPAGMAVALLLARRGWKDITIIEKQGQIGTEDKERSYVYMVDWRGKKILSQMPGMMEALNEFGVSTAAITIQRVMPDGEIKKNQISIKDPKRENHFMPRPAFLKLLFEKGLQQDWAKSANITLLTSTEVTSIARNVSSSEEPLLHLQALRRGAQGEEVFELQPQLIIGADGQSSTVRDTLHAWEQEDAVASGQKGQNRGRFTVKEFPSPAAGLRYKVLRLPPNPVVTKKPDAPPMPNPSFAVMVGKAIGAGSALRALRMGMLPVKDTNSQRLANLITRPDHKVWEVTNAEDMYRMLETSMPQIRFRELVSPEAMQQFALSKGGRFPRPQLCEGLQYLVRPSSSTSGSGSDQLQTVAGVLLIGDSRASFPPDLGQGVNSALEDVHELSVVLEETGDDLQLALPAYESRRAPDIAALIQLMTFSFPWQYNQDPFQRNLWNVNFAIRALLSKLVPAIFSPHSFMLTQASELRYRDVLHRAHQTTQRLYALAGALALALAAVLMKWVKAGGLRAAVAT